MLVLCCLIGLALPALAVGQAWAGTLTGSGSATDDWPTTPNKDRLINERNAQFQPFERQSGQPFSQTEGVRKVLILGDSMARELYGSIHLASPRIDGIEVRRHYLDDPCMPDFAQFLRTGSRPVGSDPECWASIESIRDAPLFEEADLIVLNAHWGRRGGVAYHPGAMELAERLVEQGREVAMVGILALQDPLDPSVRAEIAGLSLEEKNQYAYRTRRRMQFEEANTDVRALADRVEQIRFLDKAALFCDDAAASCALFDAAGREQFVDTLHLSLAGAQTFGTAIAKHEWFR
ncbi:hypothetical protein CKO25_15485 [Thiocapsa imhoffii]|uniref:SGNH domain-containing protein n=1 Tax=Thiocapsa imhoffii TaxID=382777 RepID=A0A9X1BAF2_9GAMM|nr:SGNH hydrolase domain-containing protein [Thiocapsa imhoffii]MBK1646026.1 hypothetical protein [Thiocapsa imhoffii]